MAKAIFVVMSIVTMATTTYNRPATVVHTRATETVFETSDGNQWAIWGTRKYKIGEKVTIRFHNNGTENVTDDIIVEIRR